MNLTKEEIQLLIQICNSIQLRVDQASNVIIIIQKLQKLLQQPKEEKEESS